MDKKAILFSIGLVAILGISNALMPASRFKEGILIGLAVFYCVAFYILFRKRISKKEKEVRAKINELKSDGQDLSYDQEADLNSDDLAILKKERLTMIIAMLLVVLIFAGSAVAAIHFWVDIKGKIFLELAAAIVLISFCGYALRIMLNKNYSAVRANKKTIVRGIITDKRIEGDETDVFFLEIEKISVCVKKKIYLKYEIGDGIEVHLLKNYHNLFLYEAKMESMNLK